VVEVEVIGRDGTIRTRPAAEYRIGYRKCLSPVAGEGFLAARLHFGPRADADDAPIRALLERRRATQPIGEWSCGSVFTNPPGDHAARLIEAAGLKGRAVGGARVSPKHANFIVNEGAATAADLETLIAQVQKTVETKFGIRLVPEVRVVGEAA
jgi:UDP-N-acetylmuramate dehydrogenase